MFPSQIVRQVLIEAGLVQADPTLSWRCVTQGMPDGLGTLDDMVAIIDREDITEGRFVTDGSVIIDPHIQIIVRGVGYQESYSKAKAIADFLDVIDAVSIASAGTQYTVYRTTRTTNIQFNGVDRTGRRYVHSIEYNLTMH